MAYQYPFNATLISGSTQAKDIDLAFRNMHSALIERLEDKFVISATADPWVLKSTLSGSRVNKQILVPFTAFLTFGGGQLTLEEQGALVRADNNALVAPVILPQGVTVTSVNFFVGIAGGGVTWKFYKIASDPPFTKTEIAAGSTSTQGAQVLSSAALSEVPSGNETYYLFIDSTTTQQTHFFVLYGARVTYTTPSHLNTL